MSEIHLRRRGVQVVLIGRLCQAGQFTDFVKEIVLDSISHNELERNVYSHLEHLISAIAQATHELCRVGVQPQAQSVISRLANSNKRAQYRLAPTGTPT